MNTTEQWKIAVLEHFEGNEICNPDGLESERANLRRAENIVEEFIDSDHGSLQEYLLENHMV